MRPLKHQIKGSGEFMQIKHIVTVAEDNVPLKNILRRTLCLSNALLKKMKMTQNVLVNGTRSRSR